MKRIIVLGLTAALGGLAFSAHAQETSTSGLTGDWNLRSSRATGIRSLMLIDPSRLTVTHSVSMSYGMGSAYGSTGSVTGAFLNHVEYRVSNPLHLWVDVGVGFRPSLGMDQNGDARVMVPGFGLLYQPSDHLRMEVIFQNPEYYRYSPYRTWPR